MRIRTRYFIMLFSLLLLGGGGITAIKIEMREQALREAESKARGPEA